MRRYKSNGNEKRVPKEERVNSKEEEKSKKR